MKAKDAVLLLISEGFVAFTNAALGLLIARRLSVSDFGTFSTAFALAQIISIVGDSGMGTLAAKKMAHEKTRDTADLDSLFTWRLVMLVALSLIAPLAAWHFLPSSSMILPAALLTAAFSCLLMTDFFAWVFKGLKDIQRCASLQIGSRLCLLFVCGIVLWGGGGTVDVAVAYSGVGILSLILSLRFLAHTFRRLRVVRLRPTFFIDRLPDIYKIGGILVLNTLFSRLDVMLVSSHCGGVETGLYSAAVRVIDGLRMVPTVAIGLFLPAFSAARDRPDELRQTFRDAYAGLFLLSLCVALVGGGMASTLFPIILGPSYSPAAVLFRPLVWSSVMAYSNMLMFALLYALNDHQTPAIAVISALGLDLVLNLLFLPSHGPIAASWSRLAAESLLFVIQAARLLRKNVIVGHDLIVFIKPLSFLKPILIRP